MTADGASTVQEIAELTARLRRLTELGSAADPSEREAFLASKRELLARIEADQ
jgi:hypothetical protein